MATCPLCLFANPSDAAVCGRCGKFHFPADAAEPHTHIVAATAEADAVDESSRRTIRGPLTVPTGKFAVVHATVTATPVGADSDAYSVVTVENTPAPVGTATPRLIVIRGERPDAEYPVYQGKNYVGRAADKPVDIDLTGQESAEQVWSSRQHAVVTFDRGLLVIEDLNSLNGTFVNRSRLHPGQQRMLQSDDVVQVGTVQFKVMM